MQVGIIGILEDNGSLQHGQHCWKKATANRCSRGHTTLKVATSQLVILKHSEGKVLLGMMQVTCSQPKRNYILVVVFTVYTVRRGNLDMPDMPDMRA